MKRMSEANSDDFDLLLATIGTLDGFDTVQDLAQAFVTICHEHFHKSLVLLRLFSTVPFSALSAEDRQLVEKKMEAAATAHLLRESTPVLTLLGTRGRDADWNERNRSKGFRCIPLVSSAYVASLSMLSMQFKSMSFDLERLDDWDTSVIENGRADMYSGMLYVHEAGVDRDDQNRLVVPRQEFVTEHGVKTSLGFGSGYASYPAIVILFAFTDEVLTRATVEPFAQLLDAYISISEAFVKTGSPLLKI